MKVIVQKSFEKDISKIVDKDIAIRVLAAIEGMETAEILSEIRHLKKLKADGSYYRVRIGGYRIGMKIESGTITLLRFLSRKDIYKYFP